jgi:hypothetical protein
MHKFIQEMFRFTGFKALSGKKIISTLYAILVTLRDLML